MPLDLNCPKCRHVFPVAEARHPVGVQCPGCDAELTAEFRRLPVPQPGESPYELLVSVGRPPGSPPLVPSGGKAMKLDDEEKERHGGGMGTVIAAGLGALVVTLCGLGATGYFLFTHLDVDDDSTPSLSRSNNSGGRRNNNPNPAFDGAGTMPGMPRPERKPDRFELRPVKGALPAITPPALPSPNSTLDLSSAGGRVGAITVAGGGRYLVMHFPDKRRLALFDASRGQVVASQDTEPGDLKLAGGLNHVVSYANNNFRVYSLPNLQRKYDDNTVKITAWVTAMAMGSQTDGPMLVVNPHGHCVLLEVGPTELKEIEGARRESFGGPGIHSGAVKAFPDGKGFVTYDPGNYTSVRVLLESGRNWKVENSGYGVIPGPDDRLYGNGVITEKKGRDAPFTGTPGRGTGTWFVPATRDTKYFLKLTGTRPKGPGRPTLVVTVHQNRNGTAPVAGVPPLTDIPDFANMVDGLGTVNVPVDEHFFFIPEAKLLVVLSRDRTKLLLNKIDVR